MSDQCKLWDINNGGCTECYDGYTRSGVDCVLKSPVSSSSTGSGSASSSSSSGSTISSSSISSSSTSSSSNQGQNQGQSSPKI